MFPPRCLLRSVAAELLPGTPGEKKEGIFACLGVYEQGKPSEGE